MLCKECLAVLESFGRKSGGRFALEDYFVDTTSISVAAPAICYICKPGIQHIVTESPAPGNYVVESYLRREGELGCFSKSMTITRDGNKIEDRQQRFFVVPQSKLPIDLGVGNRKSPASVLDIVSTAKTWIRRCLEEHVECHKNTHPPSHPTRLLELGASGLRMVYPAVDGISDPYVALSYCWGPNPIFIRLTASNQAEMQAGISFSRLPVAFREAIRVVKGLGYRYIWIDSLCIIQSGPGSIEDWRSESARMRDVYSHCIVNISLSRAASPDESCLRMSSLEIIPPFRAKLNNESHAVFLSDYYLEALYNQPLGLRAWAFQERLLAPRVLSFGLNELFWDCVELPAASESFPAGLGEYYEEMQATKIAIPASPLPLAESYPLWLRILEDYTARGLTYPEKDRLTALSAIASKMQIVMDDAYIAGHFWKTMPYSLNWTLKPAQNVQNWSGRRGKQIMQTSKECTTPSWSWASIDGPIWQFNIAGHMENTRSLATAEEYTLGLVDEANPFGQCAFATVTIRAYCAEVAWNHKKSMYDFVQHQLALYGGAKQLEIDYDDDEYEPEDGTCFLLAALVEGAIPCEWSGLVLQEVTEVGNKRYKRVAHFAIRDAIATRATQNRNRHWLSDTKEIFEAEKRLLVLV